MEELLEFFLCHLSLVLLCVHVKHELPPHPRPLRNYLPDAVSAIDKLHQLPIDMLLRIQIHYGCHEVNFWSVLFPLVLLHLLQEHTVRHVDVVSVHQVAV